MPRSLPIKVSDALRKRISVRAFLDRPVTEALLRAVLEDARWSPSGGNVQPWRVIAVAGAERQAVIELARHGNATGTADQSTDYPIYPADLWEPHRTRRFKIGEDLYALLGIPRDNKPGRVGQFLRNYEFFDAPVGLFFIIDSRMGRGQWAHLGMFMMAVMLAATEHGLATCPQEAWARFRNDLKQHFSLAESEVVYCGMALGYADTEAAINRLRSDRAAVEEIISLRGF